MRHEAGFPIRLLPVLLLAVLAPMMSSPPAGAQESRIAVRGVVTSAEGEPLVGYRVVFRLEDYGEVFLSSPSTEEGEYAVALPAGRRCRILAVISPRGRRIELEESRYVQSSTGARADVVLDLGTSATEGRRAESFPGADRLFLSFVEDTAIVERYRGEVSLEFADLDAADLTTFHVLAALQPSILPRVECGARFGWATLDAGPRVSDESGLTDLDLWGKINVGKPGNGRPAISFGALVTLPTGDEGTGTSFDALRSKIFGAARYELRRATLTGNLGVRFNEDAALAGRVLDGRTAPVGGIGVLVPVGGEFVVVGEATYEGERFTGAEPDARILAGVNWHAVPFGVVRVAVSGGVEDGAPDSQILVGFSVDF